MASCISYLDMVVQHDTPIAFASSYIARKHGSLGSCSRTHFCVVGSPVLDFSYDAFARHCLSCGQRRGSCYFSRDLDQWSAFINAVWLLVKEFTWLDDLGVDYGSTCIRMPLSNSPVTDVTSKVTHCSVCSRNVAQRTCQEYRLQREPHRVQWPVPGPASVLELRVIISRISC
jgi:hypothetical protein